MDEITGKPTDKKCGCGKPLIFIGEVDGITLTLSDGKLTNTVNIWLLNQTINLAKHFDNFRKINKIGKGSLPPKQFRQFIHFLTQQNIAYRFQQFDSEGQLRCTVSNQKDLEKKVNG